MNAVTTIKPDHLPSTALLPKNLEEAMKLAEVLSKSDIVPKDYQGKPGNVLIAVQWGMEIGLGPLQALQNIASINGRPALWGDAMLALVRGSGLLESISEDITDTAATCTVQRRGQTPVSRTFSLDDAKKAGLIGKQGPWSQYPKRMMQMRARAWALRDEFTDVLKGLASADEERDRSPTERDMGTITPDPAPTSSTDRIKARLVKTQPAAPQAPPEPQPEPVTLEEITQRINAAQDDKEMRKIAQDAKALPPEDLAQARELWSMKRSAMAAQSTEVVDAETGEIQEPQA